MSSETVAGNYINLPDAPAVPGLKFRTFRGPEDYPALTAVNNGSKIADQIDNDLHTVETLTYVHTYAPNFDQYRDLFIAEVNGEMVGYQRVSWEKGVDGSRVYWHFAFILPEWRGKGIEQALLHAAERRAREIDAAANTGEPAELRCFDFETQTAHTAMILAEGYKPVRWNYEMETPDLDHIPDVPMPEGIEIRPVKPEQYRAIWTATDEAFRDHWGARQGDEQDYERWLHHPMSQPDLWVVAWDGDEVVGSIQNFINHAYNEKSGRKLGYTENISVRRPWRRKGVARAMLSHSMKMHKDLGMTQTALGVDTLNPSGALELYESMGYKVVKESTIFHKPL